MAAENRVEKLKPNPYLSSPGDYLAKKAAELIRKVKQFDLIFRSSIESYERQDFSFEALPALRIYNLNMNKIHESHYVTGDLSIDIIFPPAIQRQEMQDFQDIVSGAMLQQFRRPSFFTAMREAVPGLNELGKEFSIDKSMGMVVRQDIAPLTQIKANFRIDLKEWDEYLEREGRTKDEPFIKTLEDLETIYGTIKGLLDDNQTTGAVIASQFHIDPEVKFEEE